MIFMGKPKFSRKKYETPSHPWQADRIKAENEILRKYGLKNKREILAKIDGGNPQVKKESEQLLMHLTRMNILPINSNLDDVLALDTELILSRRLQTLTYLKGLANTPTQSRQLISHGHIAIAGRTITVPSYMVTKSEESEISYAASSPLNDLLHPARPSAEFKSIPIKKESKPEEQKEEKPAIIEEKEKTDKIKKETIVEKTSEKEPSSNEKSSEKTEKKPSKTEEKPSEKLPKNEKSEKQIEKPEEPKDKPTKENSEDKNKSEDVKKGGK